MKILFKYIFALSLFCQIGYVNARQPYQATVTVNTATVTVSDPNLVDLTHDLRSEAINKFLPFYTPVSPVSIDINLRGVFALTSFAANSTTLVVVIPQTGVTQTFTGGTRDESLLLFKDFVRDAGVHHELLPAYAKYSPIDPIAGNPNSLMAQMAQADYLVGHLSPLSGCDCSWGAQPIVHQVQSGLDAGRAFSGGYDTTIVTLPLRYSFSPDLEWAFIIDAPISYIRNGGASSLITSVGFGVRVPITYDWSITSVMRGGAGGSLDLCTSGCFLTTGLTSVYNYKIYDFVLSMTNYGGYFTSTNLWLTGINFNYHLHNWIFKNGLALTSCEGLTFCNRPLNLSLSFVDSYFTGHQLYMTHYDEVGVTLITNYVNPCIEYDSLSLGFVYQFGQQGYNGYYVNCVYQF